MKEKIRNFMYGRYGLDKFGGFLIITSLLLSVFSRFDRTGLFYILSTVLLVYYCFRVFSKNIYKRSYENEKYLRFTQKFRNFFEIKISHLKQRKTHHIYSCPQCRQKIRIPRGKGKICIRCPKCHNEFIRNS